MQDPSQELRTPHGEAVFFPIEDDLCVLWAKSIGILCFMSDHPRMACGRPADACHHALPCGRTPRPSFNPRPSGEGGGETVGSGTGGRGGPRWRRGLLANLGGSVVLRGIFTGVGAATVGDLGHLRLKKGRGVSSGGAEIIQ